MSRGYLDQRLFLRVVELGSLRAAARENGLEASSVSRRLTRLEARLGVSLLERTTGATVPTEAGRQYYNALRGLLAQIDMLETGIARKPDSLKGVLRVAAPSDFGQSHVARWLRAFRRQHPGLEIVLTLSDPPPSPEQEDLDLVVTTDPVAPRLGLSIQHLAHCRTVLVAAQGYLDQHGAPETAMDLVQHQHVFCHRRESTAPLRMTAPDGRVHAIRRRGGMSLGALAPAREAALASEGILWGPEWALRADLERGALCQVLPAHQLDTAPLSVLWRDSDVLPGRVPGFVAHAQTQMQDLPGAMV